MKALSRGVFSLLLVVLLSLFVMGLWSVVAPEPAQAAPFPVTLTTDTLPNGVAGELRWAINSANATPGVPDTINFNIPLPGVQTITPLAPLPTITDQVLIDGYSQPGSLPPVGPGTATILIELDGTANVGPTWDGLHFQGPGANNSQVRGLVINRWGNGPQGSGIVLDNITGVQVDGNYIGTDNTCVVPLPNLYSGVNVINGASGNTIGGPAAANQNVISGNQFYGVEINNSTGNFVEGNLIGTDSLGTAILPNNFDGVFLTNSANNNTVGGSTILQRNIISGNGANGVLIDGSTGNSVEGNYIGTAWGGTTPLMNGGNGVCLNNAASANTVGGSAAGQGNVLSGNNSDGIEIDGATGNFVEGNLIGTDFTGTVGVMNSGSGLYLLNSANTNTIGGSTALQRNVISGNNSYGIYVNGSTGNTIQGNYIGPDATGGTALANSSGIYLTNGANSTTIGGSNPGEGNVISGNGVYGIYMTTTNNNVEGNLIGTNAAGTLALQNLSNGIYLATMADNNTIGGSTAGHRNVISGNRAHGIQVQACANTQIQGNYIGTDITGSTAIANGSDGVFLSGGSVNTIGGITAAYRNVISGNNFNGIHLDGTFNNTISANYIGIDTTGAALANGSMGIQLRNGSNNNTIGGTTAGERNFISGNGGNGIFLDNATFNDIWGNYIGTDTAGTGAVPNSSYGVSLINSANNNTIGGNTSGHSNIISGNGNSGVYLNGSTGNDFQGNYIGTNATGSAALANGWHGIELNGSANNNTIGGNRTSGEGNVISGNTQRGIEVTSSSGNNIRGNLIGTDSAGASAMSNNGSGVWIASGSNNTVGGTIAGYRNVISGNGTGGSGEGVFIGGSSNTVQGNYIGTNATGAGAIPNGSNGVLIMNPASGNTVGGTTAGQRNVISGNTQDGVSIDNSSSNNIWGNYIGTDATGTGAVANSMNGVSLVSGANSNTIGGTTAGEGNVISGNSACGININNSTGNFMEGNYIGTNATGTGSVPNSTMGVNLASGANSNTIGGTTAGERNVISGNTMNGVYVTNSTGNIVSANYIGTDAAGTGAVANNDHGVSLLSNSNNNTIGGNTTGHRNVISGNADNGVVVGGSTGNDVQGNYIGTDAAGTGNVPNGINGVYLVNSADNTTVGGSPAGANLIANNGQDGVGILTCLDCMVSHNQIVNNTGIGVVVWDAASIRNEISRNSIYGNGALGIDLLGDGVTPNDGNNNNPAKPNRGYNFPVFSANQVPVTGGNTYATGTAPPNAVVEFYYVGATPDASGHGQGQTYLGNTTADGSGNFSATLTGLSAGDKLSAIAISPSGDPSGQGNTSEFSLNTTAATGFTVDASVSGTGGTVDPASQVVIQGSNASIDIDPDAGYHTDSITDNGCAAAVADPYVINNVTADHAVVVTFASDVQPSVFYFAEGYTGAGFQEYLCLGNPGDEGTFATITYMFPDGSTQEQEVELAAKSRTTVDVNGFVGADKEVSAMVGCDQPIVAERPMYFSYQGQWMGGHDTVGASSTSDNWYFAEGYTGTGFDEWICVLNPGDTAAELTFRFQTQEEGEKVVEGLSVPAHSRGSFKANDLLGGVSYQTSLALESTQPVVAERPIYFSYSGTGGWGWTGGHCVMGVSSLASDYYFAEGTTRGGFEEWLTLQNPGQDTIDVQATYMLGTGETVDRTYPVPASTRSTVYVPDEVGADQDVSVYLTSSSPFLAERPMYFSYQGMGAWGWTGGHCVIGATADSTGWFFAEGYTGFGFEEWICIQNPGATDAAVTVTYYPEGGADPIVREHEVAANSRYTIPVNVDAGADLAISAEVSSNQAVICERPMYFNYSGAWAGGHDVVGYSR